VTFDIPLWDGAVLQNISLSFNEQHGADATVNMTAKALVKLPFSSMTNEFVVTGTVDESLIALHSELDASEMWRIGAVKQGFWVHDMELTVAIAKASAGSSWQFTGLLHGEMAFGTDVVTVDASFPSADGVYVVEGSLTAPLSAAEAAQVATGSSSLVGGGLSGGSVAKDISAVQLEQASFKFISHGNATGLQVSGSVSLFGGSDLQAVLSVNETSAGSQEWAVAFAVAMESDFKLSSVSSGLSSLDSEFVYGDALLVVSSQATDLTLKGQTVKMAEAGVHFQADVPVANNSKLAPLSQWMGAGDVAAYGTWGESSDSLSLGLVVTFDIPLWDGASLQDVRLSFNEENGKHSISMSSTASVTLPYNKSPFVFLVSGSVDDTSLTLATSLQDVAVHSATGWSFDVVRTFTVYSLSLSMDIQLVAPHSIQGRLGGLMSFGEEVLNVTMSMPSPSGLFELVGDVLYGGIFQPEGVVNDLLGHGLPNGNSAIYSKMAAVTLVGTQFSFLLQGPGGTGSLSVSAQVALFHAADLLDAELVVNRTESGTWGVAFGAAMSSDFSFSDIKSSYSSLDEYHWGSATLCLSTYATTFNFRHLNLAKQILVSPGVSFNAVLPFSTTQNSALAPLSTWFGTGAVRIYAAFNSDSDDLTLGSELDFTWRWSPELAVTSARLMLVVGKAELKVAVAATLSVTNLHDNSIVGFTGELSFDFDSSSIGASFTMNADWSEPLGLHNVVLEQSAIAGAINIETGVPTQLTLASGLKIGHDVHGVGDSAGIKLNVLQPKQDIFEASFEGLNLAAIVQDLTFHTLPASVCQCAFNIKMQSIWASFTPSLTEVVLAGVTYAPGFHLRVTGLNLYNKLMGNATVSVETTEGVVVDAYVEPFAFPAVDGTPLLSVSGSHGGKISFQIILAKNKPVQLGLDAKINLWKYESLATIINITDSGWSVFVNASMFDSLLDFEFQLDSEGPIDAPTDFTLSGTATNSLQDYLATSGVKYVQNLQAAIETQLNIDEATVSSWYESTGQADLSTLDSAIDSLEGDILGLLSGAAAELAKAQQKLAQSQRSAEELSTQISADQAQHDALDCKWYNVDCHAQQVWLDTKMTALRAEQLVREGVVDVAQALVTELQKTVSGAESAAVTADLDAKYVAQATLNTTKFLAETAFQVSKTLTAQLGSLTTYVLKQQAEVLNFKELSFAGSLNTVQKSGNVSVHFVGVFFGHTMDHSFSAPIGDPSSYLDEVYKMMQGKWISNDVSVPVDPGASSSPTGFDRCQTLGSCAECSSAPAIDGTSCGWCQFAPGEGMCKSGSSSGMVDGSTCHDWRFGTCDAPPPPPPPAPVCPSGLGNAVCSAHGTCNTENWSCECATGWKGSACEYDCSNLNIYEPMYNGNQVEQCQYPHDLHDCGSESWVAGQICQKQYGTASTAVSYANGQCHSSHKTTYISDGSTCETHWYNFGDCQCTPIVNVVCTNPAAYCQ